MKHQARELLLTPTGAFRAWTSILTVLLTVALLAFFTIRYVTIQNRKICELVVLLDDRNQKLPPAPDPDTERFRVTLHNYRVSLGCR